MWVTNGNVGMIFEINMQNKQKVVGCEEKMEDLAYAWATNEDIDIQHRAYPIIGNQT